MKKSLISFLGLSTLAACALATAKRPSYCTPPISPRPPGQPSDDDCHFTTKTKSRLFLASLAKRPNQKTRWPMVTSHSILLL